MATAKIGSKTKLASHTKACWERSISLAKALHSFVKKSQRFWQLFHSLVHHVSRGIRVWTSVGPFFGRSTVSKPTFQYVLETIIVLNQLCQSLRPLLRCEVADASPMQGGTTDVTTALMCHFSLLVWPPSCSNFDARPSPSNSERKIYQIRGYDYGEHFSFKSGWYDSFQMLVGSQNYFHYQVLALSQN